jgi:DNA-binding XRE family transcriptional regulator
MNPIKSYRTLNSLTQAQLAQLARVTPQVVLLAEAGVYTTMPPKLKHICHADPIDYLDFQLSVRQSNRSAFEDAILRYNPPVASHSHPHVAFRELVSPGSYIGYCKMLAIAPMIVRNYERRLTRRNLHPLIKQYLKDAKVEGNLIEELEVKFEHA